MKVESLDKNNLLLIHRLSKFYKEHYNAPDYLIRSSKEIEKDNREYIIIKDNNFIFGVTSYEMLSPFLAKTSATVIHKDRRRKGMGSVLNNEVEWKLKSQGVKKLITNIYVDNVASIMLKLKRGWEFEARLNDHDEPGLDEYVFFKSL